MRERSDDNLLTRLLLFLWLPLAAVVGLVPLEEDDEGLEVGERTESAAWQVDLSIARSLWDPPERPLVTPIRVSLIAIEPAPLQTLPVDPDPVLAPTVRRAAYTTLLRHQLLRIPDVSTPFSA